MINNYKAIATFIAAYYFLVGVTLNNPVTSIMVKDEELSNKRRSNDPKLEVPQCKKLKVSHLLYPPAEVIEKSGKVDRSDYAGTCSTTVASTMLQQNTVGNSKATTWIANEKSGEIEKSTITPKSNDAEALLRDGNDLFQSHHFSDERILCQLCDGRYQTILCDHNWPALEQMGPCFWTLAESILKGKTVKEALADQSNVILPKVLKSLESNPGVVLEAMREIAESYLSRGVQQTQSKDGTKEDWSVPPKVVLQGKKGKKFRPVEFIASGSAGVVYTAERVEECVTNMPNIVLKTMKNARFRRAVKQQLRRQLALKRIRPTQKDSAENEYRIAATLAENDKESHCVSYLDKANESDDLLWLLLRRIYPGPHGVDLREYIEAQVFKREQHLGRKVVLELLKGVAYISGCGIIMRDVKPDNVLVEYHKNLDGAESFLPRWTDFGLSVDVGRNLNGSGIRSPRNATTGNELKDALVGWWYDTQKLVPKPKWKHRRPPERCYQDPNKVHISSYDIYMVGIVIVSISLGVDFPHIEKKLAKENFERSLDVQLPDDYLETFELGEFIASNHKRVLSAFMESFGPDFGEALLHETSMMLNLDPQKRPLPNECVERLLQVNL